MSEKLDRILVSSDSPKWHQKLKQLRQALFEVTYFTSDDKNHKSLMRILKAVRTRGDSAVQEFTKKFDDVSLTPPQFKISNDDLEKAHKEIDPKLLNSLKQAIENVKKYQTETFIGNSKHPGIKYNPIERVGICIPGASAPLPSTVIMTAVPAQVAGVEQIAVISPPRYKTTIHPVILAVCFELGINEVYRIGGAHAVAALAYGTQTITPVNKIVGPGNQWVQMAKKEVLGYVGIDSIAGPSEVLIIADENANPAWIAADMLSQAEHNPGSAVLFTDSQTLAENTLKELETQLAQLSRIEQTAQCLENFSRIVVFDDLDNLIEHANDFASEHLQIQCGSQSRKIAEKIKNAGAIFIGNYTPVATGDYFAGPSHTLPTGQTSKFFSPLSANDFIKSTSIIEYDRQKLNQDADDIIRLAETEGLDAHAKSIKIRQKN
jgi:histidinol dehydrogenase